ncbi:unnamed protein product [Nesidiocoris tenuis]|uniref:Uncharacterized protein n=1 Tax=Nesidiocoris tenuis TaxID=355587 RepID=A0A6H5HQJ7_9HEMI|nr:unnamed protein product [Nesidiocoris tenuis]
MEADVVKRAGPAEHRAAISKSAGGTYGGVRRQRRRLHRQKVIPGAEDCGCKQSDNGALMSRRAGDGRYQARQAGDFWVERAVSMTTQTSILPLVPGGGGRQEARGQELESGGCGEKSASIASRVTLGQSPTSASLTPEHTPTIKLFSLVALEFRNGCSSASRFSSRTKDHVPVISISAERTYRREILHNLHCRYVRLHYKRLFLSQIANFFRLTLLTDQVSGQNFFSGKANFPRSRAISLKHPISIKFQELMYTSAASRVEPINRFSCLLEIMKGPSTFV